MVADDFEHQDRRLLTLQEEAESISVDSSDDSFQDLSFKMELMVSTVCEQKDCSLEFDQQNPCLQSAVTHLQEKFLRINKKIQDHRYHKMSISSWLTRREILPFLAKPAGLLLPTPASCSVSSSNSFVS